MSTHAHFAGEFGTRRSLKKDPALVLKKRAEQLNAAHTAHNSAKTSHTAALIREKTLVKSAKKAREKAKTSSTSEDIERWRVASAKAVKAKNTSQQHADNVEKTKQNLEKATLAHSLAEHQLREHERVRSTIKRETADVVSKPDFSFSADMRRVHGTDEHPAAETFLERNARLKKELYGDQSQKTRWEVRAAPAIPQQKKSEERKIAEERVAQSRSVNVHSLPGVSAVSLPPSKLHRGAEAVSLPTLTKERKMSIINAMKESSRKELAKLFVGRMM